MVDHEDQIGFIVVVVLVIALVFVIRKYLQYKKKMFKIRLQERHNQEANQQDDIYNISARVQGQGQWLSQEGHQSHYSVTNEVNKYNDDPPTYDEAMHLATVARKSTD